MTLAATPGEVHHTADKRHSARVLPHGTRRGRILVVDDEPQMVSALRRVLSLRHEVFTATTGRDALARLNAVGEVDVILCDLMMPELTGMDVYRSLSQTTPVLASRVVFLTGGAFTQSAREFLSRVPNDRLQKPFDVEALCEVIAKHILYARESSEEFPMPSRSRLQEP